MSHVGHVRESDNDAVRSSESALHYDGHTDVIQSRNIEAGTKTSGYSMSDMLATTMMRNVPAADDTETEVSHHPEAGTKVKISQVSCELAAGVMSRDQEVGTKINIPHVSSEQADQEAGTKINIPQASSETADPEAGTSNNISQVSSELEAGTMSPDSPSPGRYIRKPASMYNAAGSPQSIRRPFRRTNAHSLATQSYSDPALSRHSSHTNDFSSLPSRRRHLMPASDAFSMETTQSSDDRWISTVSHKRISGCVSLPSTPQSVNFSHSIH